MNRLALTITFLVSLGASRSAAQEAYTSSTTLEMYKPAYFLQGQPDTKIQVSLKLRLAQGHNLYLGYTQLMIWQFIRQNSHFSDVNYNPEIFYRCHLDERSRWVDLGIFEHESDGKSGTTTARSWNRTYLRGHDEWSLGDGMRLRAEFKAWVPYLLDPASKNLPQYRGLYETNLILSNVIGGIFDRDDLILRLYPGGASDVNPAQGGQELTLRLHPRRPKSAVPVVTLQVFHGFAESLLTYRRSYWAWRAGIGF